MPDKLLLHFMERIKEGCIVHVVDIWNDLYYHLFRMEVTNVLDANND